MIEVSNESGLAVDEQRLIRLATFALTELRIHPQSELSILCVDEDAIAAYHERYLDLPGPTDVMSFPMDELRSPRPGDEMPLGWLGDIVLCPSFIARQAEELGKSVAAETDYLLIHGLLHLLGHDHDDAGEKLVMFGLNDQIIEKWQAL